MVGTKTVLLLCCALGFVSTTPTLSLPEGESTRLNLAASRVTATADPAVWQLLLVCQNDNGDDEGRTIPVTFTRFFHVEIGNLDPNLAHTFHITLDNAYWDANGQSLHVLSTDGGVSDYERAPEITQNFTWENTGPNRFRFWYTVPIKSGIESFRLARYFPYPIRMLNAFLDRTVRPRTDVVTESVVSTSKLGRPIRMFEITDGSVPLREKRRVWIHAGVHPAETTSHWIVEGFLTRLLDNSPESRNLLREYVYNVLPMVNPDGNFLGNFRTNSDGVDLERRYQAPYQDRLSLETIGMQAAMEGCMASEAPIEVLLNLHSIFQYRHTMYYRHTPEYERNGNGVTEEVHRLEQLFIDMYAKHSPLFAVAVVEDSRMVNDRTYVESMMNDRWSAIPEWSR